MGKNSRSGSGISIRDHISESLQTIFWVKIINFFDADADPGSGNLFDWDLGWKKIGCGFRDKPPGSATLD
jgi:hypothetical protein